MTISLANTWPTSDLHEVGACPVCGADHSVLLYQGVRDWAFESAPGVWQYWSCSDCESLFLNPRPTPQSIGRAYASYYTHAGLGAQSGFGSLKLRWKNERLSARLGGSIEPRLHLHRVFGRAVRRRADVMALPFGWQEISDLTPGRLMDVGCGSGRTVALAQQLGWDAVGLEMDRDAVRSAREAGLTILEGGYERLREHPGAFDCIVCSHVIEHVYIPNHLIRVMHESLKPGGTLLLATPNALSDVHQHYGKFWRGLEAPRHLVLFSERTLISLLMSQGFSVESRSDLELETVRGSARIARQAAPTHADDRKSVGDWSPDIRRTPRGHDFIKLIARKQTLLKSHLGPSAEGCSQ